MAWIAHMLSENFFSIRAILASFQSWRYKWLIWWQWESNRCLPGGICCIKHRAVDVICADRGWLSSVTQIAGCRCVFVYLHIMSVFTVYFTRNMVMMSFRRHALWKAKPTAGCRVRCCCRELRPVSIMLRGWVLLVCRCLLTVQYKWLKHHIV